MRILQFSKGYTMLDPLPNVKFSEKSGLETEIKLADAFEIKS